MNEPWKKKKRVNDFFFDFDKIEGMLDELMKNMMDREMDFPKKPLVMGFSMRLNPEGKPIIEEIGNIKTKGGKPIVRKEREPLVDVIKSGKEITITAELPGVEKKDMSIKVPDKNSVIIRVGGKNSFYKEIKLDEAIKKESGKAKFKNGILEITFKKEKPSVKKPKEGEIKIE